MRILVVDDNRVVRTIMKGLLNLICGSDVQIEFAQNGQEALEIMVRSEEFDLIISDNEMPLMNGVKLLRSVRLNERLKHTPFVLMSTKWDVEPIALAQGAWFFEKPVRRTDLMSVVSKVAKRRQLTA